MAEYGNGISMRQAFELDRDRVIHALHGQLACDIDANGIAYYDADPEECEEYILHAFDNAVYEALNMALSARALEKIAEEEDIDFTRTELFNRYMYYKQKMLKEDMENE